MCYFWSMPKHTLLWMGLVLLLPIIEVLLLKILAIDSTNLLYLIPFNVALVVLIANHFSTLRTKTIFMEFEKQREEAEKRIRKEEKIAKFQRFLKNNILGGDM